MEELSFVAYEAATVFVPFLIALAITSHSCKKRGISLGKGYYALVVIFAIYIFGVFYVTGAGTIYDLLRIGLEYTVIINPIPFSNDVSVTGYALNIILFVPFGILVPLIWKRLDNWKSVLLSGLGLVVIIELSQLCNYRATDIDDVIMNMLGTVVGYLIFIAAKKLLGREKKLSEENIAPSYQLPLFVGVMFLGRFLLYNYMGFASILYPGI